MASKGITYSQAGVDIEAGERFVDLMKRTVQRTYGPRVIRLYGAFAGLFRLDYDEKLFRKNYRKPVLVACCDGVGSKVLLAIETGRLHGVGIDVVAMNVNDMLTVGAEPLFLLDYLAVNRLKPQMHLELLEGIAEGCRQAGCALLGGETAELPDIYQSGHFDLAAFAVGVCEHKKLISGRDVEPGDDVIGIASSGLHSNGYTLARRVIFGRKRLKLDSWVDQLGCTIADELLKPTRIYVEAILRVLSHYRRKRIVRAMAHITGGGLPGNVSRVLPAGCRVRLKKGSWPIPPIFDLLEKWGVPNDEMWRVFNMGIGYVLIVRPAFTRSILKQLKRHGQEAYLIGKVRRGQGGVEIR